MVTISIAFYENSLNNINIVKSDLENFIDEIIEDISDDIEEEE